MKRIFDFATLRQRNTRRNNHGETAQPRSTVRKLISTALAVLLMTLFSGSVFAIDIQFVKGGGIYTFSDKTYGGPVGNAMEIKIKNTNTSNPINKIIVTLTGAENALELTGGSIIENVAANSESTTIIKVSAIDGYPVGTHVATLKAVIEGVDGEITQKITLTVNKKNIDVSNVTIQPRAYNGSNKLDANDVTVTFSPAEILTLGTDYTISGTYDNANAGTNKTVNGSITLTDDAAKNYNLTGNTTISTTGDISKINMVAATHLDGGGDKVIIEYTYDGTAKGASNIPSQAEQNALLDEEFRSKTRTAVFKNNAVRYGVYGSTTSYPSATSVINAGDYEIWSDVASQANFTANQKLKIGLLKVKKATLTDDNVNITLPASLVYDGGDKDIEVEITGQNAAGADIKNSGIGDIKVEYSIDGGDTYVSDKPVNVGEHTYRVTIAEGTNYDKYVYVNTFTITQVIPEKKHIKFEVPTTSNYDGKPRVAKVYGVADGYSNLYYSKVYYKGTLANGTAYESTTAPVNAGMYDVYVSVNDEGNFKAGEVKIGDFTINKASLSPADFTDYYPETTATYDGEEHAASTYPSAKSVGIGEFKQWYYRKSPNYYDTIPPTNAGTYDVEIKTDGGENYAASWTKIGTLKISQAVPTAADLAIPEGKGVYNGALYYIYTDDIIAFPTPVAAEGIKGMGGIHDIRYDGSTDLPTKPGKYAVTVDISGSNSNYAYTNDLLVGYLIISDAVTPAIVRPVKIIGSEYFTSSRTDSFLVNSGGNLTFTLTPAKPLPEGQELKVSTNRHIIADDEGGLFVTPNPDGTYTVFIPQIKEAVEVTISTVATTIGTGSEIVSDATRVWSSGGQLIIAAGSDSGQASIYAVSGVLVKTVAYAAGETVRTALPTGIYVAVAGNRVFKVVINN